MFFSHEIVGGAGSKINRSYKLLLQVILVWIAVSLLHFTEPTPNMVGMPCPCRLPLQTVFSLCPLRQLTSVTNQALGKAAGRLLLLGRNTKSNSGTLKNPTKWLNWWMDWWMHWLDAFSTFNWSSRKCLKDGWLVYVNVFKLFSIYTAGNMSAYRS